MDYEGMLETFYRGLNLEGTLVVDVGGHVGRHAFPLSDLTGENGSVYSFELLPEMRAQFVKNMCDAQVSNVALFPFALSSVSGVAEFCYIPNLPQESGFCVRGEFTMKYRLKSSNERFASVGLTI